MSDATSNLNNIEADSVRTWDPVVKRYVDIREGVVGLAPETLDTLGKIAASIANNSDYAAYVDGQLQLKRDVATSYSSTEVDTALALKANQATTYTKTETDTALALKANQATTYTKAETDTALALKRDVATSYSSAEVDAALALKANQATTYTKTETDSSLAGVTSYVNTQLATKANQATTYTKTETDDLVAPKANTTDVTLGLATKADQATTYTKAETDNALTLKRDVATSYSSAEVDAALALKANQATTYTKTETDTALALKANQATTYTKTEADTALALKRDVATSYSSTEVDTALASKATPADITAAIDNLVNAAPGALDTLNELAAALGNDPNFATTVTNQIATKAPLANPTFTGTVSGITKAMVGLGSVDDTADAAKPISTATQAALDLKADSSALTSNAAAWSSGALGDAYHYIDTGTDALVVRTNGGAISANFLGNAGGAATEGKALFYKDVEISGDLLLSGQTLDSKLALKADLANPTFTGTVSGVTKAMVGLGSVDDTADAAKPISTATQAALDLKANSSDVTTSLAGKQDALIHGSVVPASNYARVFDSGDTRLRAIQGAGAVTVVATDYSKITIGADCYTKAEADSLLGDKLDVAVFNDDMPTFYYNKTETDTLLDDKEPAFGVIAPLQKGLDLGATPIWQLRIDETADLTINNLTVTTDFASDSIRANTASEITVADNLTVSGNLQLNGNLDGWSPFWCAGKVNENATMAFDAGYVNFTVAREPGYPTGVYKISMSQAHPRGSNYVVQITLHASGYAKVWDTAGKNPTSTVFWIVTYAPNFSLTDKDFFFTVLR